MKKNKIQLLILQATETIPDRTEFDAKIIQEILEYDFEIFVSTIQIGHNLKHMDFSRRRPTPEEIKEWRSRYGTRPRIIYIKHKGSDPSLYEHGIPRRETHKPTITQLEIKEEWNEECAKCPEFDDCQGTIRPCPRYPDQTIAPKDRVMKLEDFE